MTANIINLNPKKTMNPNPKEPQPDLTQLARQWGARTIPFTQEDEAWLQTPAIQQAWDRLNQCSALRSALLISGPNGVGKSELVRRWINSLDARLFVPLVFTQATLSGSSLLASVCQKLGKLLVYRRERQLQLIEEALVELDQRIPIIILDEAQNYTHSALEEIRLLLGLNLPAQPAFALILVGDQYLLNTLKLRHHRALYSRLGSHLSLPIWEAQQSAQSLQSSLLAAGLTSSALQESAQQLLISAAGGLPRSLQLLAQAAWIAAATSGAQSISHEHVQKALDSVPHVPGLHQAPVNQNLEPTNKS